MLFNDPLLRYFTAHVINIFNVFIDHVANSLILFCRILKLLQTWYGIDTATAKDYMSYYICRSADTSK